MSGIASRPIFVLDFQQFYDVDDHDAWLAPATWSEGGRSSEGTPCLGRSATRHDSPKGQLMWAASTTEKLALKKLAERLVLLRQHNDRAEQIRGQVDANLATLADLQL